MLSVSVHGLGDRSGDFMAQLREVDTDADGRQRHDLFRVIHGQVGQVHLLAILVRYELRRLTFLIRVNPEALAEILVLLLLGVETGHRGFFGAVDGPFLLARSRATIPTLLYGEPSGIET